MLAAAIFDSRVPHLPTCRLKYWRRHHYERAHTLRSSTFQDSKLKKYLLQGGVCFRRRSMKITEANCVNYFKFNKL
uniref:Uncharacterized protein n=1 Tax=Romanomermis culicivorax TaxID=13658 RepID=A0A915KLG2_ROMCU